MRLACDMSIANWRLELINKFKIFINLISYINILIINNISQIFNYFMLFVRSNNMQNMFEN